MPIITTEATIEFSVYCATCGAGLCGNTTVNRRGDAIEVEACPHCIAEKNDEINELQQRIEELESEISSK